MEWFLVAVTNLADRDQVKYLELGKAGFLRVVALQRVEGGLGLWLHGLVELSQFVLRRQTLSHWSFLQLDRSIPALNDL